MEMTHSNLKCDRCDKKFSTSISLLKHRNVPSKYKVKRCGEVLQKISLSASMVGFLKHNQNFKRIQCNVCQKGFCRLSSYFIHLLTHKKQAPYVCDYCSKAFIIGFNLRRHLESHKEDIQNIPKCKRCLDVIDKLMMVLQLENSSKCYKCPFCHIILEANKDFLIAHLRIHFPEHSTCANCNFRIIRFKKILIKLKSKLLFKSSNECYSKTTNQAGYSLIACEICGKQFKSSHLAIHLISHSMENLYCKYCNVMFGNHQLKRHEKTCKSKAVAIKTGNICLKWASLDESNPKQCPFCSKAFLSFTTLKMHLPTHARNYILKSDIESLEEDSNDTLSRADLEPSPKDDQSFSNIKPYTYMDSERNLKPNENQCNFCHAIFENASLRNLHEINHCRILNYFSENYPNEYEIQHHSNMFRQCQYCKRLFMNDQSLNFHLDCHFGKLSFVCKICQKVFTNSDCYAEHKKKHLMFQNNNNTYNSSFHLCEICGEIFLNINVFQKHLKTHGIKCIYCLTYFSSRELLYEHMKQHLTPITGDKNRSKPSTPFWPEAKYCGYSFANAKSNKFDKALHDERNNASMSPQNSERDFNTASFYKNRPILVPFPQYQFRPSKVPNIRSHIPTGNCTEYQDPLSSQKNKNNYINSNGSSFINESRTYNTSVNFNDNFSNQDHVDFPYKNVKINEHLDKNENVLQPNITEMTNFRCLDYNSFSLGYEASKYSYSKSSSSQENSFETSNILDKTHEDDSLSETPLSENPHSLNHIFGKNQSSNEKQNEHNRSLKEMKLNPKTPFLHKDDTQDTNTTRIEKCIPQNLESKKEGNNSNQFLLNEHSNLVPTFPFLSKTKDKECHPSYSKYYLIDKDLRFQVMPSIYGCNNDRKDLVPFKNKFRYLNNQSYNNDPDSGNNTFSKNVDAHRNATMTKD